MLNDAHLTAERMAGYTHVGTVGMRSAGTAVLIALGRSANASPLAFLALPPDEATTFAADIMHVVIGINNGLPREHAITLPGFVEWLPFGTPPDSDRLVLISNEGWPEEEKTWVGWFDAGCWYTAEGSWLDGDPDSGTTDMPPTHWAEIPQRHAAKGATRP